MDTIAGISLLDDSSIDVVITSSPYNVGMSYEEQLSEPEYYEFLREFFHVLKPKLKPDGRICWNVPYQMYTKRMNHEISQWYLSVKAMQEAGLNLRDNITWNQSGADNDTAWGSWKSASSPWLRHQTEAIIVAYNEQFKKINHGTSTITSDEFMEYVRDVWTMVCARREFNHPAPFPIELPLRCIKLFSYLEDTILDPFMGSGTTALACIKTNRNWIGFEKNSEYCDIANMRISAELDQLKFAFMEGYNL